eukprot:PITA_10100
MDEEINAIERNKTWDLVELPKGKEVIGIKWIYKIKSNAKGKIEGHKAMLVVKGYKQQYGRDYEETFALVSRMRTVRAVLSIAAQNKWKVYQMDVKSAFLNRVLMEEVYIEQPLGYVKKDQEHKVCRLKKALYGLKQAPRACYSRIDSYLLEIEFEKCEGEPTVYIKEKNRIEVDQNENGIFISKARYVNEVLERFHMQECKAAITPTVMGLKLRKEDNNKDFDPSLYKSIVGSLMYLTATRPDIMYAVSLISRFMERPKEAHWQAAKRILRYVKGTKKFGILYTISECSDLVGYTDSDWAGSVDDRKSTFGYVFHMSSGAISWASKKQPIVTLSIAEVEYVAATTTTCQAVWMRRMLRSLGQKQVKRTVIYCDNNSAIALSKNSVFHKRTKHIETRFHYIRELVNNGEIVLVHCKTQEQVADILTKPLGHKSFEFLRKCMGMTDNPTVETKGEC